MSDAIPVPDDVMQSLRTIEGAIAGIEAILTDTEHGLFDETDRAGVAALVRVAGAHATWLRECALTEQASDGE